MPRAKKICDVCGKTRFIMGFGKCNKCYQRDYHRDWARRKDNIPPERWRVKDGIKKR